MVLARLQSARSFSSHPSAGNGFGIFKLFSTMESPGGPVHQGRIRNNLLNKLYRRISRIGYPEVSIVPVLDQWIQEGQTVNYDGLLTMIKELRYWKKYAHALEVSTWMSDKRYYELTSRDIAIRLDLIARVHGIEEAQSYFDNTSKKLRTRDCYSSLLHSYALIKDVEKAEMIMQKMRDLGFANSVLSYNTMLNLHCQNGNYEKAENLVHEMQGKGIHFDKYTYGTLLNAYADTSNIGGIDYLLTQLESDHNLQLNWDTYSTAATAYRKVGLLDKAFSLLKKSEELIISGRRRRKTAFNFLLTQYAAIGKKEEVIRIWEIYRKEGNIYNKGYIAMITAMLKFDDIESAEKIFEEWESKKLSYDIRIPNYLIGAYCRKGLVEAAEALVNWVKFSGGEPDARTWYYLARGCLQRRDYGNAVEYMREVISIREPWWMPRMENLAACLEYLKGEGDMEEAEDFVRYLRNKDLVSSNIHDRLLKWIEDKQSSVRAINILAGDGSKEEASNLELPEREQDSDSSNESPLLRWIRNFSKKLKSRISI